MYYLYERSTYIGHHKLLANRQIGRVLAHTLQKDYYASQYIYTVRFCKAKFPQII